VVSGLFTELRECGLEGLLDSRSVNDKRTNRFHPVVEFVGNGEVESDTDPLECWRSVAVGHERRRIELGNTLGDVEEEVFKVPLHCQRLPVFGEIEGPRRRQFCHRHMSAPQQIEQNAVLPL
jgi:hypothetical protein